MKIDGKVAVVVGGTTGIGWCCVDALLQKGAKVCFGDDREAMGKNVADSFNKKYPGNRALYQTCDVTEITDVEELVNAAKTNFGEIEIFLNTAGFVDEKEWEKCIDVNFRGTTRCVNVALQAMGKKNGGRGGVFTSISSMLGLRPGDHLPVYTATKWAINGLILSWAEPNNFLGHGIRFNCICPTCVHTPILEAVLSRQLPGYGENDFPKEGDRLQPSVVADGFIQLVENDEHNGKLMRISKAFHIDFATLPQTPLQ